MKFKITNLKLIDAIRILSTETYTTCVPAGIAAAEEAQDIKEYIKKEWPVSDEEIEEAKKHYKAIMKIFGL